MYNYLFYFLYSYYNNTKKWSDSKAPFFSSILVISTLIGLNFLSLRDIYLFQLNGIKNIIPKYEFLLVPSIIIILNFLYFKHNNRYLKILKEYKDDRKNQYRKVFIIIYIILTILLAIITAYSHRNNLKWI